MKRVPIFVPNLLRFRVSFGVRMTSRTKIAVSTRRSRHRRFAVFAKSRYVMLGGKSADRSRLRRIPEERKIASMSDQIDLRTTAGKESKDERM